VAKIRAPALSGSSPNVFFCLRPLTTITKTRHLHQTNLSSSPISLIRGLASLSSLLLEHIRVGYRCGQEQSLVIFVLAASHRPGGHTRASLNEQATNKEKTGTGKRVDKVNFVTLSLISIPFSTFYVFYELELRCTVDLVVPWCRSCPSIKFFHRPTSTNQHHYNLPITSSSPAVRARRRTCHSFILSITYPYVSRSPISRRGGSVPGPAQTER
jgi:hypothetical protein